MNQSHRFRGTGVALTTPFDAHKNIDLPAFAKLLTHTRKSVDFWVIHGTTGEAVTTSFQEKQKLLGFMEEHNPGELPIVFGLGGNYTAKIIEQIRKIATEAYTEGINAFLSASPSYNKPTQEGIFQHYTAIADASPKPIILYNVPSRTASNITAETTLRLAEHPNIIGIKEASGDMLQCIEIVRHKPDDFILLSGDDATTIPMISIGAEGVIGVTPNVFPVSFSRMVKSALDNKYEEANRHLHLWFPFFNAMFEEGNPVGIKALLSLIGIGTPAVRLPLVEASDALNEYFQMLLEKSSALKAQEGIISVTTN
ncbi:MAG: 4-hydroxy-tetrahydrodipicolinate synthase [Bernardetiaceae bacterium]|nr:4-hydroxy-tetrahydrodipicolinate synthase [Bernardetiaceae bacterium]